MAEAVAVEQDWSDTDLEEVLYKNDEDSFPVIEYRVKLNSTQHSQQRQENDTQVVKDVLLQRLRNITNDRTSNATNSSNTTLQEEDDEYEEYEYQFLDFDFDEDQVHIVEFYAPWCPHCQAYKPNYINLAREVQRRVIGIQITFHAVSCTLNEDLCLTYGIDSYPTIYGWRGGTGSPGNGYDDAPYKYPNITDYGILLNPDGNPDAESIAHDMNFDIAEEEVSSLEEDDEFSKSEDAREYKIRKAEEAAKTKRSTNEFQGSINELYHDATVSMVFALKTGIFTGTPNDGGNRKNHRKGLAEGERKNLNGDRFMALNDFLSLVEWATPSWWSVRRGLVKHLLVDFDILIRGGKKGFIKTLEPYQVSMTKTKRQYDDENMIWGYIQRNGPGVKLEKIPKIIQERSLGVDAPQFQGFSKDEIIQKNMRWTRGCTHEKRHSGYTCGLWHIFHILTIGASQRENRFYGFHMGYDVSPHRVAESIRNFVEYFFGCEVCRHNFLEMYDNCGHDHCTRLTNAITFDEGFASKELALWLFEVHNAVNVRLMRESAERNNRVVTKDEELAAIFPSRRICPKCWLDDDMEVWDPEVVFDFLKGWYWPVINRADLDSSTLDRNYTYQGYYPVSMIWFYLLILFSLGFIGMKCGKRRWVIWKPYKLGKIK